ncbi:MAG: DUF1615 domain-containing protein [Pseudomonadota bacterium]
MLVGCANDRRVEEQVELSPVDSRALINKLLPANTTDRSGWAADIYAAFDALEIAPTPENICAVVAVTEQESTFRANPIVPSLATIAWKEIDKQAEHVGIPPLVVRTALLLPSPNGKSYSERIDSVKTEKELSEVFEDFIGMVPMGKRFFADRNPIRTGGPMQVSIAFAEAHAAANTYPYRDADSIRHEVFTRRGGMYFGIAHLLDYPASYDKHLYRFADFNAGHYASRNAAFQSAVSMVSGKQLQLDGDLIRYGKDAENGAGKTELATRALAKQLDMSAADIRHHLEKSGTQAFERTRLYKRVFALADKHSGDTAPRAVVPRINLKSPKISRKLTTEWFARRVDERFKQCMSDSKSGSRKIN